MKKKPAHHISDSSQYEMLKRPSRREREHKILMEVIEYYIKTGKPVGSHTLQDETILDISSATIRNYFASLEEEGYLKQQHTSGGRIPQAKGYSLYAATILRELEQKPSLHPDFDFILRLFENLEPGDLISSIQAMTSEIARKLGVAALVSSPRFDQDTVSDIKYIYIDSRRFLSVVITEFGLIYPSVISLDGITQVLLKKAERFSKMALFQEKNEDIFGDERELELLRLIYQEAMASYFTMYSNVVQEDIFRAGFSHLFSYPEFQEGSALKPVLSLFENSSMLRGLLREAARSSSIRCWIGNELEPYCIGESIDASLLIAPYYISGKAVGAIGLIGPMRLPYKELFCGLQEMSLNLSQVLTQTLVKHRITFQMPGMKQDRAAADLDADKMLAIEFQAKKLLCSE